MPVNPDWTRDELILALDLYFRADRTQLSKTHPEVIRLSELFRELDIPPYRAPGSITMKLGNFVAIDPENPNKGLDHGQPNPVKKNLDFQVWGEFSGEEEYLSKIADAIRRVGARSDAEAAQEKLTQLTSDENEEEFSEGKILTRLHKSKERNREAVKKKKQVTFARYGKLACEVCDFDFVEIYGEIGQSFAECHHIVPLSELRSNTKTRTSDLAIVCANCHRMLHKARPVLGVDQLREIVLEIRSQRES